MRRRGASPSRVGPPGRGATAGARAARPATVPAAFALAATLATLLATPPARAAMLDVAVVTAEDIGWRHPQVSDDHRVVVMERYRNNGCVPSPTCPLPRLHDIGVLDLGVTSAQDVLRLLTSDGRSHDPSTSADGTTLAFWRSEVGGGFSIVVQALDGSGAPTVFADPSDEVGQLDLSPAGRHVAYWRRTGSTEEVVILDAEAVPAAIVASDSATDVILGDQRPIDAAGNVVYSKIVGAVHELHRMTPGGAVTSLDVAGVEELEASVSADGAVVAFVGLSSATRNVWTGATQITFNGNPALDTAAVAVSPDGSWIAFHSEADLTAGNPDQTWEVFRVRPDGMMLQQVSDITPPGSFGDALLDRVTTSRNGDVLFWGQATCPGPCTILDGNELEIRAASPSAAPLTSLAVTEVVRPPFDVVTDVDGFVPALGCSVEGATIRCVVAVRASADAGRDLVMQPEWTLAGRGGECEGTSVAPLVPRVLRLDAGRQVAVVEQVFPACSPIDVTLRVRVVGGELGGQPDFSLLTAPSVFLP